MLREFRREDRMLLFYECCETREEFMLTNLPFSKATNNAVFKSNELHVAVQVQSNDVATSISVHICLRPSYPLHSRKLPRRSFFPYHILILQTPCLVLVSVCMKSAISNTQRGKKNNIPCQLFPTRTYCAWSCSQHGGLLHFSISAPTRFALQAGPPNSDPAPTNDVT